MLTGWVQDRLLVGDRTAAHDGFLNTVAFTPRETDSISGLGCPLQGRVVITGTHETMPAVLKAALSFHWPERTDHAKNAWQDIQPFFLALLSLLLPSQRTESIHNVRTFFFFAGKSCCWLQKLVSADANEHGIRSAPYDPYIPNSPSADAPPPKTQRVQAQVDEVVNIMQDNIDKVMQRGERLDDLRGKTGKARRQSLYRVDPRYWYANRGSSVYFASFSTRSESSA